MMMLTKKTASAAGAAAMLLLVPSCISAFSVQPLSGSASPMKTTSIKMSPFDEFHYYAPSPIYQGNNNNYNEQQQASATSTVPFVSTLPAVQQQQQAPPPPLRKKLQACITQLDSHRDVLDFLNHEKEKNEDRNRLSILFFHAHWCKSCHKVWDQYRKLARQEADLMESSTTRRRGETTTTIARHGRVRLASIEWSANLELCQSLGVTRLPTVYFYHNQQLVESFSAGPKLFGQRMKDTLQRLLLLDNDSSSSSTVPSSFENTLEEGSKLIEETMFPNFAAGAATLPAEDPTMQQTFQAMEQQYAAAAAAAAATANQQQ